MEDTHICLVSDTVYDLNGVSRFIQDFAKEAIEYEKSFHVITSTTKKHYESIENIYNIPPLFKIKMPFYKSLDLVFPSFFKIHKILKKLNPDLIHISTPGTVGLCALLSAKILKKPIVGIYHTDFPSYMYKNTNLQFAKKVSTLLLRWFYAHYKVLFTRSQEYKKIIQDDLHFDAQRIFTLKAGINTRKFHPSFKNSNIWKNYDIDEKSFKVLYVGRVSVEKNIDWLIELWKIFDLPQKALILVGDDEYGLDESTCKAHNIYHLGRRQKEVLSSIYASADCFIFPSTTDTLGQVVMEAMASALPVLVSDQGGPKTFVHKDFGFINPLHASHAWIDALVQLSKKDQLYEDMSQKAFNCMQKHSISDSFSDFWCKNENILAKYRKS